MLLGKQGAGKGTQADASRRALRRRAPLDRRHLPRAGGAGHRVRARGQALHGRGRARARRDRHRRDRGVPRARRSARRRLRARRVPAHAAPGRGARPRARRPTRSTSCIDLDVPARDRARPASPAGACARTASACTTSTCRPRSTGPATRAAGGSCSATTTPRRRSSGGSSSTSSETVPIIDYYRAARACSPSVDGVGDGDDVFERLVKVASTHRSRSRLVDDGHCARRRTRSRCMRRAGAVVAEMHEACTRAAKPGATTADLDARGARGARPARAPVRTSSATTASRRWRASRPTR